jgi:hypothetical protein
MKTHVKELQVKEKESLKNNFREISRWFQKLQGNELTFNNWSLAKSRTVIS